MIAVQKGNLRPMQINFVRHGESMGNMTGDYSTNTQDHLSPAGQKQADALAERLADTHFDVLYCSPLERAIQTILPLARTQKCQVEVWPELAESCWQEDQSLESDTELTYEACPALLDPYEGIFAFRDNEAKRPIENENYAHGLQRLTLARTLLEKRHRDSADHILIVSHGYTIGRSIEMMLGLAPIGRVHHDNTGHSLLQHNGEDYSIRFINRLDSLF
jgi:broad specificity phosphatase PhoE